MPEPRMRSSSYTSALKHVRQLPAAQSTQILQKIKPESLLGKLENVGSMDWVEVTEFLPFHRAIASVLVGDAFYAFWKRTSGSTLEHPILKGPLQFVAKITGMGPKTVVKSIQNSWTLFSRDMGRMVPNDTASPTSMELHWEDVPASLVHESALLNTFPPSFSAMFDLLRRPTRTSLKVNPSARVGVFAFDWS